MDYLESVRTLGGAALDDFARVLYERDVKTFEEVLAGLTRKHTMRDYMIVAAMLANVTMSAKSAKHTFADATGGTLVYDPYFDMYLKACRDCGVEEVEYIPLLLSAQYAHPDSALFCWDKSVNRYVEKLARADFDRAAGYIDRFDKKFGKYVVLIAVNKKVAINRLVNIALYGKGIDKAAARDVLMDYDEVSDALMALYGKSNARDKVAIVRLLLAYKNDGRVRDFLNNVAANDRSKSVRDAAMGVAKPQKSIADPCAYLERIMAEGTAFTYGQWHELFADERMRAVAEKIFFYFTDDSGEIHILLYNDGEFIDKGDRPISPDNDLKISILHSLDMPSLSSLNIDQPFLQLSRPVFHKIQGEKYGSARLGGTMILRDEFRSNMKKYGFMFCDKRSESEPDIVVAKLGKYVIAIECDLPRSTDTVSCGTLSYYNATDVIKIKRKTYISSARPLDIGAIPRREFSELTYLAYRLFGNI